MIYFKKILRYALPYKRYAFLNIFFNILYAVFSALSFVVLMPLFEVIFKTDEKIVYEKPVFEGFTSGMEYLNNYFNYYVSTIIGENQEKTLLFVVVLIVVIFLLKNMFGYLSFYYITFLKNGVLKFGERIGTRNKAEEDEIKISFKGGDLLIYISNS